MTNNIYKVDPAFAINPEDFFTLDASKLDKVSKTWEFKTGQTLKVVDAELCTEFIGEVMGFERSSIYIKTNKNLFIYLEGNTHESDITKVD